MKKLIISLLSLFVIILVLSGCSKPEYNLTVNVSPTEGGSVSPQGGTYEEGTSVSLLSTPSTNYLFKGWSGGVTGTMNPVTIVMDSDKSITGIFELKKYPLNITIEGEGTVTEEIVTLKSYDHGTTVKLTPVPTEGWEFVEWGGDIYGSVIPVQVTLTNTKNITCKFIKKTYPLNITIEGEGTVTEEVVTLKSYDHGTTIKLTPIPSEGWEFVEWSGDLTGTDNPVQVTITDTTNVTCNFIKLNPIYLGDNGITIKCYDWGEVGDSGEVNGVTFTIVDKTLLKDFINSNGQGTLVCTSKITDMSQVLYNSQFNQDIGSWDVSNVTNMSGMFWNSVFNQDISSWNVSNVSNMYNMFYNSQFNQDISTWNVSNVTNMYNMFSYSPFNQDISSWDVSKVMSMKWMFLQSQFNQDISSWNVSNVTNMSSMFSSSQFNQDISSWDVSKVTDMSSMFNSSRFNQDISSWDVSNVTNMSVLFGNSQFNQDISSWDVSNVTDMNSMFGNSPFNQDIGSWNVSNVTDMNCMFNQNTSFNQDISSWDISNVTNMFYMFYNTSFNQDIGSWDVSKVTNMFGMFRKSQFKQDISSWDVSNVTNMSTMFYNSQFNQDLSSWEVSNVTNCSSFSTGSILWTLPKPDFTNCICNCK